MNLATLRPNVGIVLIRPGGQVWLGRRASTPPPYNWQFPQGGVDAGEGFEAAARRELYEETGVTSVHLLDRTPGWIAYEFPSDHGGSKLARGWTGQKQIWFAFLFEGQDKEVNLHIHGEIEFDTWRWAELDEALDAVVPFKREAYVEVIETFRPLVAAQRHAATT